MAAVKSAAGAKDYRASRRRRAGLTFTFLAVALCVVMVLSAGLGQYNIPTDQVVASVGRRLGLAPENPAMQLADSTLWNIRFPRVLLGVLVGAALGTSGAVMQSVFGNPLAEPGVIGVSSGAAVGGVEPAVLRYFHDSCIRVCGCVGGYCAGVFPVAFFGSCEGPVDDFDGYCGDRGGECDYCVPHVYC